MREQGGSAAVWRVHPRLMAAAGLLHGLGHTHRTIMEEAATPPKRIDERLGHEDVPVQARYSHVTPRMRARLSGRTRSEPGAI
ncbi:hypothetical protein OG900_22520 [Streptomyces sp. NBC_00433]